MVVRREEPHPGASYNLFDPNGLRPQALITNSQDWDIAYLEARHRLHARVEDRIKEAKECGLANFPCSSFQANRVWLLLVQMAQDLLAWASRLCLPEEFLEAAPKRLRYQVLHVVGRLVRSGRRTTLRLDAGGRGRHNWRRRSRACGLYRCPPDTTVVSGPVSMSCTGTPPATRNGAASLIPAWFGTYPPAPTGACRP